MNIKQYKKFKFQFNDYSLLDIKRKYPISYIAIFFYDAFRHIYKFGTREFIDKLEKHQEDGMSSEMISLDIDNKYNLAYISELIDNSTQKITPEIRQLIESDSIIELCHRNFIGHAVMTIKNLVHLLLMWDRLVNNKNQFLLLYLDDQDWYDVLPFDTQEAMEKFVADHTKVE